MVKTKTKSFFGMAATALGRALSLEPLFNTGGSNGGSQMFYSPRNGGPNANLRAGFARMRSYSRDITRKIPELDDGYDTRVANIIGCGIRAISMCQDDDVRHQIKTIWPIWCKTADYDGWDISSMDRLLIREADEAGEVFLRRVYLPQNCGLIVPIQFQIIESENLDHTYTMPLDNGGYIIAGVEYDSKDKVVAYHFWKNNPENVNILGMTKTRIRVPADDVCHWFERKRAGQVRGTPRAHSGQMQMRDLMLYEENELERKKNSSATYATITSTESSIMSELGTSPDPFVVENGEEKAPQPQGTDPNLVSKGMLIHLYPGEKLEETKVAETDSNYDAYVCAKNRSHAKSLGLSYESYTGDMRGNSYSGIRVAKNLEETKFGVVQDAFIQKIKDFVWTSWFDCAVMCGAIKVRDYRACRYEFIRVNWQAPGWKYINPLQEINATAAEINAGISTRTIAAAARGRDFEEIQAQLKREKELENRYGNIPQEQSS